MSPALAMAAIHPTRSAPISGKRQESPSNRGASIKNNSRPLLTDGRIRRNDIAMENRPDASLAGLRQPYSQSLESSRK